MIKENQRLLNTLNILSDGIIIYLMLPIAFWLRFKLFPGVITVPLRYYMMQGLIFTVIQIMIYAAFGQYQVTRRVRLRRQLPQLWFASALDMLLLMSWLFLHHEDNYSRQVLFLFFALSVLAITIKRILIRRGLQRFRSRGFNQKHVVILGNGHLAELYLHEIRRDRELGYHAEGFISANETDTLEDLQRMGGYEDLEGLLDRCKPDEVISAVGLEDFDRTPEIIAACENTGCKLSIIPHYAEYMSERPQFDDLNGIPLLNIRRIPLDNWGHAFAKRLVDIVGSALILILASPLMLFCAIGVKLSSPGPVIFRQQRIGLNKKPFMMYKFRSMRINDREDTGWSQNEDDRKTKFGSFIRKYSLDEFPQFWNVLRGDMSLVGPRPEVPFYVEQFREKVPLYMVKHQVRPGITGWAQVNGFRGDTSIDGRIQHDIYYIEHWSMLFDCKILWMTVFGGAFKNEEMIQ